MNKQKDTADNEILIKGEVRGSDKLIFACDVLMVSVFLWNQIRYGMDMLFLIIPLVLIGVGIVLFALVPALYCFTEAALEVRHRFQKTLRIPYGEVFNFQASVHDNYVNIVQENTVKVYYTIEGKKRVVLCRPRDVETFIEIIKKRSPELQIEESDSRLQVFFTQRNKKGE